MTIRANCKINLGLRVVSRREDGYHELQTVMLPVKSLYDVVEVEAMEGGGVEFAASGIAIDCPAEKNLMVRAARLMQQRYDVGGVSLTLDKRVPFGAGLGGGSADATAVIVAMNDIFSLALSKEQLSAIAAELGSDTPFFVYNTPQYCTGRGEIMRSVDVDLSGLWLVVVKPEEGVSTAEAYAGIHPAMPEDDLTELLKQPVTMWRECIVNDFEEHIFRSHPRLAEIKASLYRAGAIYASMSGSGSALFGLFAERPEIEVADGEFLHVERC